MGDEIEIGESEVQGASSDDDRRFEVKWKKKGEPPRTETDHPVEPASDLAALQQELESERKRARELQERWHRAAADLSNLRKRTEQERDEVEKFSTMVLVQELLPVLDNFDRAFQTIPRSLQMLTWIHGVMLIDRHLRGLLERQGLAPIEARGQPFNARYHEAISERETDDEPPGTVIQDFQTGYTMHGRVIRPALVEVARAVTAAASDVPVTGEQVDDSTVEHTDREQGQTIATEAETENTGP